MPQVPRHALLLLSVSLCAGIEPSATEGAEAFPRAPALAYPLRFDSEAVVSQSVLASRVGADVLAEGGNAVDAAVATALTLAVVHPEAGNIGGGGFLVVLRPDGTATTFDFRETAPRTATEDMFLDESGKYDPRRHHEGALSVGVPGSVAGLYLAHRRLGRLPWPRLVEPAVKLAREGFRVSRGLAEGLRNVLPRMRPYPAAVAQFTRNGTPLRPGDVLVQEELAGTLERIRDSGPKGFYEGPTADLLVAEMRRLGGRISHDDLRAYEAKEREPIRGTYRGFEIISMPPPSSGGVALVEMLGILEGYDLGGLGLRGSRAIHLTVEAMRRAFADRALHLGDPDFVDVPVARLTSPEHATAQRATIRPLEASRSSETRFSWPAEGEETTHLSTIDREGMAVSLTTTLEQSYGSSIVVPGAGFLLNNEMGDFNPVAGLTTREGLIGTPPNRVAPSKRMLSSMTPTIVARDGRPFLVVGSPGGRTIINTVLLVILGVVDHGLSIQDAIDASRYHHQWLPDTIVTEPRAFSPDTRVALEMMGHEIVERPSVQGSVMALAVTDAEDGAAGRIEAGVDRRRPDAGAAGR